MNAEAPGLHNGVSFPVSVRFDSDWMCATGAPVTQGRLWPGARRRGGVATRSFESLTFHLDDLHCTATLSFGQS
jgi:hypothetical protein